MKVISAETTGRPGHMPCTASDAPHVDVDYFMGWPTWPNCRSRPGTVKAPDNSAASV